MFGLIKLVQFYNKICLTDTEMFFFCLFSTELDVEDFDAFLERVKARSLGSSPFVCKSSPIYMYHTLRVHSSRKSKIGFLNLKESKNSF